MWLPDDLLALCRDVVESKSPLTDMETTTSQLTDLQPTISSPLSSITSPSSPVSKPHQHQHQHGYHQQHTNSRPFPLLSLPLDILAMHLPSHLPASVQLSLRLSCRALYTSIPACKSKSEPSDCEKKAVIAAVDETEEAPARKCCLICGSWYPVTLFAWGPETSLSTTDAKSSTRVEDDNSSRDGQWGFENRICRWHRRRFERTVVRSKGVEASEQGWSLEESCMHCGGVFAWGRCDCTEPCRSCWKRPVWCYTQVVEDVDDEE